MSFQHIENLFRQYRGQFVDVKTISGGVYEGTVADVTDNYVALEIKSDEGEPDRVFVMLHSIESVLPRTTA